MNLAENNIMSLNGAELLSEETFDYIYDISDELKRARIIALMSVRAGELKIRTAFNNIVKEYNKADRKLDNKYAAQKSEVTLKYRENGVPIASVENFLLILRKDKKFLNLKFNLLSNCPEKIINGKAERWTDIDDSITREYIEKKYHIHNKDKLDDALRILFCERSYHPIKNIIENVEWDGIERISTLLIKWLKCADSDYSREVSRLIFSGGINRLYNPGCKFDDVPVLIGTKQGEGKSTFVRWLALQDDFFAEICEIEGQRGIESLEGAWICEIAELLALTKTKEVEAVKSYITKQTDRYRKPFDRRVSEYKRQCVFIGTTNKEQFLTDKTGNRRFYPIKVNQCGYDLFNHKNEIKADILQCWAEAKAKFDMGEMLPYADRGLIEDIREQQQNAVEDDYREGLILSFVDDKEEVCILEIWEKALKEEYRKPTRKESNDIALILQSTGVWERAKNPKRLQKYGLQKTWIRIKTDEGFLKCQNNGESLL